MQFSFLVFHGGSGSSKDEIREAVTNGVIKMNVDTDTQVSFFVPSFIEQQSFLNSFKDLAD